jgi:hypothetical protein
MILDPVVRYLHLQTKSQHIPRDSEGGNFTQHKNDCTASRIIFECTVLYLISWSTGQHSRFVSDKNFGSQDAIAKIWHQALNSTFFLTKKSCFTDSIFRYTVNKKYQATYIGPCHVPCLRQLVAGLLPRRPEFNPRTLYKEYVVEK